MTRTTIILTIICAILALWVLWLEFRLARIEGRPWKWPRFEIDRWKWPKFDLPPAIPLEPLPVILRELGQSVLVLGGLYLASMGFVLAMAGVSYLIIGGK